MCFAIKSQFFTITIILLIKETISLIDPRIFIKLSLAKYVLFYNWWLQAKLSLEYIISDIFAHAHVQSHS